MTMMSKKLIATFVVALLSMVAVMAKDFCTVVFKVEQMECATCERKVKNNIKYEKGMKQFTTDLETRTITITYDPEKTNVEKLKAGFQKFKYEAVVVEEKKEDSAKE